MKKLTLKLTDTEGVEKPFEVTAVNPKIKTVHAGSVYRDGHLVDYAANGELTEDISKESPALRSMTVETAKEILTERIGEGSSNFKTTPVEPKGKP